LGVEFNSPGFFTTILYREKINEAGKNQAKTSEKILDLIRKDSEISAEKLSREIGISPRAVEMQIAKLKEDGVNKLVGHSISQVLYTN
jgi:ATP-dependent DNA helicase RecG